MAIVNSVKTLFPGFGNATEYLSSVGVTLTTNSTVTTALTGFVNYVRSGKWRFKTTANPASSQITGVQVTGTDGTSTVSLYQDGTARTAAQLLDIEHDFISELNLTTISFLVTLANAGTAPTGDFEVAGNP